MVDLSIDLKEMYTLTVSVVSEHQSDANINLQPQPQPQSQSSDDKKDRIKSRQYQIPGEFIEKIDGMKFLCLNRNQVFIRRLLTVQARVHKETAHSDEGITNLSLTNIPDKLIHIRNRTIKLFVTDGDIAKADKLGRRWMTSKKCQQKLLELGDFVEITTPHVEGMESISMRVLSRFHGPVHVEINAANITWLTKAIAIQVSAGTFKSKRCGDDEVDDVDDEADTPAPAHVVEVIPPTLPERSPSPQAHVSPGPPSKKTKISDFFKSKDH